MDPASLSLAQQNYVETIDALVEQHGYASTTTLAQALKISKPSVTETIARLAKVGIVVRKSRHQILLSEVGHDIAVQLGRKHASLRHFMIDVMAMDDSEADALACHVEHCIDHRFSERLHRLATLLEKSHPATLKRICTDMRATETAAPALSCATPKRPRATKR